MSFMDAQVVIRIQFILLIYAVLRVRVLNLHLQDINDSDADHDKHENCNPLQRLLTFYLLVQMVDSFAELIYGCVKMLLAHRNRLLCSIVSHVV